MPTTTTNDDERGWKEAGEAFKDGDEKSEPSEGENDDSTRLFVFLSVLIFNYKLPPSTPPACCLAQWFLLPPTPRRELERLLEEKTRFLFMAKRLMITSSRCFPCCYKPSTQSRLLALRHEKFFFNYFSSCGIINFSWVAQGVCVRAPARSRDHRTRSAPEWQLAGDKWQNSPLARFLSAERKRFLKAREEGESSFVRAINNLINAMYARFVLVVVEIKNKRKLLSRVRKAKANGAGAVEC
jgi:hypothetical protein